MKEEVGRSMSYRYELLAFDMAGDVIEFGVPDEGMIGGVGGILSCKDDEGCLRNPRLGPSRNRCRGLMTGARRVVGDASGQVKGTGPVGEVTVGVADADPVGVAFGETAGSLSDGNGICDSLTAFGDVAALPGFASSSPSDDDVPVNALFDSEGIIVISPIC